MALAAGTKLGPYTIQSPLGAGGMGEVYAARDTRLDREVAVKVLPAEFASDAERLKRFEKEARSASALNHPNIVTIHDIGCESGISYIAMERVEGSTLRELVVPGPLPFKRLLPIATQIADGLARAHEGGIVHRDLKPENVMVTREGLVKILDFGLAKLASSTSGSGEGSLLPTMTGTSPGIVVGTVGYMSPEQASAGSLDHRSDQFALGSILYEMTTGRRAFQKKTAIDTLSAILNDEPEPAGSIRPDTPVPVRWILDRCLAKEPDGRYASTRDLARDLATVRDRLTEGSGDWMIRAAGRRRWVAPVALALGVAALLSAAAYWIGHRAGGTPPPSFRRLTFRRGAVMNARFTPDGNSAVYSAAWDGKAPEIFVTRFESPGYLKLNLPSANLFSISERSELAVGIGESLQTLARVPISGGGPRPIAERVVSAAWAPDGETLAVASWSPEGASLEYPIGHRLYATKGWIGPARVSPDGEHVAFGDHPRLSEWGSVAAVDRTGKKTRLTTEQSLLVALAWSPRGDEVWFSSPDNSIRGVSLSGRERVVLRSAGLGGIEDVSRDGRMLFTNYNTRGTVAGLTAGEHNERDLSWFDESFGADLSADGQTMLFSESGRPSGSASKAAYLRRLDGSDPILLGDGDPQALSPDGKWALVVAPTTPPSLEALPTGPGEKRTLPRGEITQYRTAGWFPDGRRIFFEAFDASEQQRVYVQSFPGGPPEPVTERGIGIARPVSPDGRLLVVRMPDGSWQLFEVASRRFLPLAGVEPSDRPIAFDEHGGALFVETGGRKEASVEIVDLATGRRAPRLQVAPPDTVGLEWVGRVRITPDGRSYIYSMYRATSDLYLVGGLR